MSDLFNDQKPELTEEEDRRLWERVRAIPGEVEAGSAPAREAADRAARSARSARGARRDPWWRGWFALPAVRYGLPALAVVLVAVVWVVQQDPRSPVRENATGPATGAGGEMKQAPSAPARETDVLKSNDRARILNKEQAPPATPPATPPAPSADLSAEAPRDAKSRIENEARSGPQTFATPPREERASVPAPSVDARASDRLEASKKASGSAAGPSVAGQSAEGRSTAGRSAEESAQRQDAQAILDLPVQPFAAVASEVSALIAHAADVAAEGPLLTAVASAYDPGVAFLIAADSGPGRLTLARAAPAGVRLRAGAAAGDRDDAKAKPGYDLGRAPSAYLAVLELPSGSGLPARLEPADRSAPGLSVASAIPAGASVPARVRATVLAIELARALERSGTARYERLLRIRNDARRELAKRPDDAALSAILAACERALSGSGP